MNSLKFVLEVNQLAVAIDPSKLAYRQQVNLYNINTRNGSKKKEVLHISDVSGKNAFYLNQFGNDNQQRVTRSYQNHAMRVTQEITLQNWWVARRKPLTRRMSSPRVWRWRRDSRSVEGTGKQVSGSGNTCRGNTQDEGEASRKTGGFLSPRYQKIRPLWPS